MGYTELERRGADVKITYSFSAPQLFDLGNRLVQLPEHTGNVQSADGDRINDVPYGEFKWSPIPPILIIGFFYLVVVRWAPRERQRNILR